jgi:hypothetical protein
MSANGTCNADNIQLIPGSLEGGECIEGSDLALDQTGTKLIGRKHGQITCSGQALVKAYFLVASSSGQLRLMIDEVKLFTDDTPGHKQHEGYRITSLGRSTCDLDGARNVWQNLGFHMPNVSALGSYTAGDYKKETNEDFVVAVAGPIFNPTSAEPIPGLDPGMFNLACTGDALAKASFFGLVRDAQYTKAALRMITANYCGTRLTVRGMPLEWESPPGSDEPRDTEAKWDHDGVALCIDHPRLAVVTVQSGGKNVPLQQLPPDLQARGCRPDPQQPGRCDQKKWIKHLQNQCDLPDLPDSCSQVTDLTRVRFTSFVDQAGKHVVFHDPNERVPSAQLDPSSRASDRAQVSRSPDAGTRP